MKLLTLGPDPGYRWAHVLTGELAEDPMYLRTAV